MTGGGESGERPFAARLARWRAVPGGVDADGDPVGKPRELEYAQLILGICREFSCLPSQVRAEDCDLLRLLEIERLGGRADEERGEVDHEQ